MLNYTASQVPRVGNEAGTAFRAESFKAVGGAREQVADSRRISKTQKEFGRKERIFAEGFQCFGKRTTLLVIWVSFNAAMIMGKILSLEDHDILLLAVADGPVLIGLYPAGQCKVLDCCCKCHSMQTGASKHLSMCTRGQGKDPSASEAGRRQGGGENGAMRKRMGWGGGGVKSRKGAVLSAAVLPSGVSTRGAH